MRTIFFVILCFQFFCLGCDKKTKLPFEIGVSSAVVNPPLGAFIAGDKQNRKFTGVNDNLFAKVAVISDGETSMALVTLDCIGLLHSDLVKVRNEVKRRQLAIPFNPENIVISSTHTHAGPDVVGIWGEDYTQSGVDPEYIAFLVQKIADGIEKAAGNRKQVYAEYAETSFGESWVANICDEEIDRSVTSLIFREDNGDSVLSLTNFACHPTFLDAVHSEVSADYVGAFYKTMETTLEGEHMFLQGAIGGWIQPIRGGGIKEEAFKMGDELAIATLKAIEKAKPLLGSKLYFKNKKIELEVDNMAWRQFSEIGLIDRKVTETVISEIALFSIGEAKFVTHPGETAPIYGLQSKEILNGKPNFVLGLGQDALGYILKPEYFSDTTLPHSQYLTSMSLGKNTGPVMMETIKVLAE